MFAAQKVLEKIDISQGYLDEVAHFIMKNTEGITLGAANPQYSDPFTGKKCTFNRNGPLNLSKNYKFSGWMEVSLLRLP